MRGENQGFSDRFHRHPHRTFSLCDDSFFVTFEATLVADEIRSGWNSSRMPAPGRLLRLCLQIISKIEHGIDHYKKRDEREIPDVLIAWPLAPWTCCWFHLL